MISYGKLTYLSIVSFINANLINENYNKKEFLDESLDFLLKFLYNNDRLINSYALKELEKNFEKKIHLVKFYRILCENADKINNCYNSSHLPYHFHIKNIDWLNEMPFENDFKRCNYKIIENRGLFLGYELKGKNEIGNFEIMYENNPECFCKKIIIPLVPTKKYIFNSIKNGIISGVIRQKFDE